MTKKPIPPLLGPGPNPQLNACLNYGLDAWWLYATGYRKAAEVLTEFVAQGGRHQDSLIYPVIFLWRHHLELRLKGLARSTSELLGRSWTPPDQHDLTQLFGETRALLVEAFTWVGEKLPTADLDTMREVLRDFRKVDLGSFVFRYPADLDGANSLAEVRYINYENVAGYFTELSDLLEAAEAAVSVFHDWKQDMLSSY